MKIDLEPTVESFSPGVAAGPPARWQLFIQVYGALVAAMLLGVFASAPLVCSRVQFYAETTYIVGAGPSDDTQFSNWARSQPGVIAFTTDRRGNDLWVRSVYHQSLSPLPPPDQLTRRMRELGYELRGMRGGSMGMAQGLRDLLADAQTLAAMLAGMQVAFGLIALNRIRAAARRAEPLPPMFPGRHGRAVFTGLAGGLFLIGLGLLNAFVLEKFLGHAPASPWDSSKPMPAATKFVFLFFGTAGAPITEEIFFRGYVFGKFKRAGHVWFGVGVSAALFGAVHFSDSYNVPCICLYGVALAWLYHRTGSLLAPIVAHAVNNGVFIGCMLVL
jgi:membrane protease YdiL (CAAX protease family)